MARYEETHKQENLKAPGDARPTALQIVVDEKLKGALKDKVFLLTGCSSGIGIATAEALVATGATVYLGARNLDKAKEACSKFLKPGKVELVEIDTSSMNSVRKAAKTFLSKSQQLNLLINNAAIMACPEEKVDGVEKQFATNFLGPFLLYKLLEPTLLKSSQPNFHSRVINVSSSGHHSSSVHLENINLKGEYEAFKAYGQSKTAMIWMTNHIERLHGKQGLHGNSVMPGGIATNLQQHVPEETKQEWAKDPNVGKFMKSTAQGAATTLYAALSKDWKGRGGSYLEDCHEAIPTPEGGDGAVGYQPHAFDPGGEKKLWAIASDMVKV